MKRTLLAIALGAFVVAGLNSCKETPPEPPELRPDCEILTFSVAVPNVTVNFDKPNATIELHVNPDLVDQLVNIAPTAEISTDATVEPLFTVAQDFTKNVTYVVTAQNGDTKTWTVKPVVSKYVSSGIGKVTKLWQKDAATLGLSVNENSIAVLGNRLIISRFPNNKLFDAATGDPTEDVLNCTGIESTTPIPFVVTNDSKGNLIGGILGAWAVDHTWKAYKWTSVSEAPEEIVSYREEGQVGTFGRRISVVGDVDGSAIVATYKQANKTESATGTFDHYCWKITGGTASAEPEKVSVPDAQYYDVGLIFTGYPRANNYMQMIWPVSPTATKPYYFSDPGSSGANPPTTFAYMGSDDLISWIKGGVDPADIPDGTAEMFRATGFGRRILHTQPFTFNGVNYMAISSYFDNAGKINIYTSILEISGREYTVLYTEKEVIDGDMSNNGNGTAGIAISVTVDGEGADEGKKTLRIYNLVTGYALIAYEISNLNE